MQIIPKNTAFYQESFVIVEKGSVDDPDEGFQ
jgi:hypothetical protein